jgi:hypothetical protein
MIRTTVKPVLSKGYTEMDGQLILDLPEEQVAVLYVYSLVKKFQVRLQKVRAAEEWTRQHFASASPDICVNIDSVMSRYKMQFQVDPIHIKSC